MYSRGSAVADLFYGSHRFRNALEDYQHLIAGGVGHEEAVARVGYTPQAWEKANRAARRAEERGAVA